MTRIEPGMPEAVIRTSREVVTVAGEEHQAVELHLPDPERLEEYRQGYRCLQCHGVQTRPFPDRCTQRWVDAGHPDDCLCPACGCHYEIARLQTDRLSHEFAGEKDLWPTRTDDDDRLTWRPRNGIWVPGDAA
jgi:hypothetical protein